MNYVASTKDNTKLIISDGDVNNALIFEYSNKGNVIVSITIDNNRKKHLLSIETDEAKIAIIEYMIDHL